MQDTDFDRLMSEVGPLDDAILACIKTQDGAYAIRFEEVDVLVEIGAPRPSQALEAYETLLSYNMLWRETGGVRMALSGKGGSVVQFVDLTGSEINARSIATVAANLASLTEIWRAFLQSAGSDTIAPSAVSAADFIRA